jgi:hypothetical protein
MYFSRLINKRLIVFARDSTATVNIDLCKYFFYMVG